MVTVPQSAVTEWEEVPRDFYIDVSSLPHRYFFETVIGERQQVVSVIEAPFVSYVSGENVPAYLGTYTISSHYEEHEGFRRRVFRLAGRSGYTPNHLTFFQRFRVFFETLMKRKKENKNAFVRGVDFRLVINAPFEGLSDYCNLLSFTWERDRSKLALSYVWAVVVETYGFSARKWALPSKMSNKLAIECNSYDDTCHAHPYHFCRRDAEAALSEVPPNLTNPEANSLLGDLDTRAAIRAAETAQRSGRFEIPEVKDNGLLATADKIAKAATAGAVVGGATGSASGQMANYETAFNQASSAYVALATWWRDVLDATAGNEYFPFAVRTLGWLSNFTMEAKMLFGMSKTKMAVAIGDYLTFGYVSRLEYMATKAEQYTNEIYSNLKDIFSTPNGRPINNDIADPGTRRPSTTTTVIGSDFSLIDVSLRVFGSRDYAAIIASMNDMIDYRTWSNGQPLVPGDNLLIPAINGLVPSGDADNVDLLGADWKVSNYDFVLNENGDDFVRVIGIDAYRQNIIHRLQTAKDENPAFPGTGITAVNQGQPNELTSAQVASEVQDQIIMDPRTGRIVSMRYEEPTPSTIVVDVVLEPVSNSRWSISFTYTG